MTVTLDNGRPIVVQLEGREPMGPLARLLLGAVVPDEASSRAERGRRLAADGQIHSVVIGDGQITARVLGSEEREYEVALRAAPIPRRVWHLVARSPEGSRLVDAMLAGKRQAVQLEHVLTVDWDTPLVPRRASIDRSCTCPDSVWNSACKHVAALAYVVADAIHRDPSLLLRWRGCDPASDTEQAPPAAPAPRTATPRDPWEAGAVPGPTLARGLPPGAVLKRLGPSGLELDGRDLSELLERAYTALAHSA